MQETLPSPLWVRHLYNFLSCSGLLCVDFLSSATMTFPFNYFTPCKVDKATKTKTIIKSERIIIKEKGL